MTEEHNQPLGLASPLARGADRADIISAVEQVTGGDSLVSVGRLQILSSGNLTRINEVATLRLTPEEREEFIRQLMTHRFADMTAELGSDGRR